MKSTRSFGIPFLALALLFLTSACQKKTETSMDSMTDTTSMSAESPYPVEETPPPATTTPPPSRTTTTTSGGTKSSTSTTKPSTSTASNSVRIPAGTTFNVSLITPVDTRTSNVGETVEAKLTAPLIVNGKVVAEQDATVRGTISSLQRASRSNDEENRASVKFNFTSFETVGGTKTIDATVTDSDGEKMVAKSTSTRDKLIIGGSTVAGAVIGKVAGKSTKSTVIGAVGGAVVGTGVVLAAKGYELEVPAGAKLTLRLDDPVTVVMR